MDGNRADLMDSDLGDDSPLTHSHSGEDDIRDSESSDEGVNLKTRPKMPNGTTKSSTGMDFHTGSPEHTNGDSQSHPPVFAPHPLATLSSLSNLINVQNLHSLQNPDNDMLERFKQQMREYGKLQLNSDTEFALHNTFANSLAANSFSGVTGGSGTTNNNQQTQSMSQGNNDNHPYKHLSSGSTKDGNPGSNQSSASEASGTSQQNTTWSFEEQFKQVRQVSTIGINHMHVEGDDENSSESEGIMKSHQINAKKLYELSDCPKRKAFLDDLFTFMAERKPDTPINRLPIMAKSVLDLYELYNLVIERGGLVEVINKKLWQEIIKGLRLPSSITSAAFTLRTQYEKFLYPYEYINTNICEKHPRLPKQKKRAAAQARQVPIGLQSYPQMGQSPMMMAHPQNQQLINSLPNLYAQMKQIMPNAIDRHMMEYLTAMNANPQMAAALSGCRPSAAQLNGNQSPDQIGLGSLAEMQRNIWSLCGANNSNAAQDIAEQREAMNLSPPRADATIKRERDSVEVRDQPEDYAVPSKRLQTGNNYHNGSINGNSSKHSNSNGNGGGHHNDDDDDDDDDDMQDAPANLVVNNRQPNHGRPFNGLPSRRVSDPPSADGRDGGDAPPIHWGSIHSLVNLQVGNPIKSKNNNQISEVPVSLVINGVTFTGTLTATDIHTPETSSEDHSPQRNRDNDNNQPPPPPPPPAAPSAGVA